MSLYSKKEQQIIAEAGGMIQKNKSGAQKKDLENGIALIRKINEGKAEGFFMVIQKTKTENATQSEGMLKVHNINKMDMLNVIFKSLKMDDAAIRKWLMLREFEKSGLMD